MRKPGVPETRLRFPVSEVPHWAARYAYEDDAGVIAIGGAAASISARAAGPREAPKEGRK